LDIPLHEVAHNRPIPQTQGTFSYPTGTYLLRPEQGFERSGLGTPSIAPKFYCLVLKNELYLG